MLSISKILLESGNKSVGRHIVYATVLLVVSKSEIEGEIRREAAAAAIISEVNNKLSSQHSHVDPSWDPYGAPDGTRVGPMWGCWLGLRYCACKSINK